MSEKYGDSVAVHLRHFPLPNHPGSDPAARAMQAALRQGKGWELGELLFANARSLGPDTVVGFAEQVGLGDLDRFKADFASDEVKAEVQNDLKAGRDARLRSTPTILVNGLLYQGQRSVEGLGAVVEAEIKKADALLASGTPIAQVYETLAKQNVAK
ncbi:MAG: thioredoxin domain-containing protein [Polyangiaceae bacterium]|nr:thioredoxin domain-containing protein [Polyangiaceae bacterium]